MRTNSLIGDFDLYDHKIDSDPFPWYQILRDEHPCYWCESGNIWILSRYDDVAAAAQDWRTFSSLKGNLVDEIPGRSGGTLGTTDPPRHDRLRALAQAAFLKKNLDHVVEPTLQLADKAIDNIKAKGSFDFVADFSSEITVGIIFQLLGLPPRNSAEMRNKVVLSISTDKKARGRNAELDAALANLSQMISDEVAVRRQTPRDDLITKLAEAEIDGDRLTEREVVLTTSMFVVAGVESLSSFMSILALNLHDFTEARQSLQIDPARMMPAIDESLRYNTSAQRFKRVLTRDLDLHGKTMREGDGVVLAYGAANRDERKFENPDVYDIARNPQGHLGFGMGKHFCIGNHFSRLVTEAAMNRFLERIPSFGMQTREFDWVSSSNFRSPMTLPFKIN